MRSNKYQLAVLALMEKAFLTNGCLESSQGYGQLRRSKDVDDPLLPLLPFMDDPNLSAFPTHAKPVLRTSDLSTVNVALPSAVF